MKCNRIIIGLLGWLWAIASTATAATQVTFVIFEDEYKAEQSLPAFAKLLSGQPAYRTTILLGNERGLEGLDVLKTTDVMVLFMRRKVLPQEQLDAIRAYVDSGHGLVTLRTSCHGFAANPRLKVKPAGAQWPTFDADVLGCHYVGHLSNKGGTDVTTDPQAAGNPILAGVTPREWHSTGSLYQVLPLAPDAKVLMNGKFQDHVEPVTWTRTYKNGRVFSTTLGHADDFALPQFQRLLLQAIAWAAAK